MSLTVKAGETVGILGRNGSGKSTLLKCICGVLQPTSGEVAVRGKLAGLLELGAGFQQDLTGRENIYLNGSLLGMSKSEIDRSFDAIVDFSELEEFIDGPVKFYSSGMTVRLGFAVAVNVDPDILVIDEVLAVGDERFQRKCIDRVKQFQKEGRTILLVTHAADTVRSICDRGVVLSHGPMVAEGDPGEATRIFRERLMAEGAGMSIVDPALVAVPATPDMVGNEGVGDTGVADDANRPVRFRSVHRVYSGDNSVPYMTHRGRPDHPSRVRRAAADRGRGVLARDPRRGRWPDPAHRYHHHRRADRRPRWDRNHALRHREHADARRILLVRTRDPEPERHPLRLAGERRHLRGHEPQQGDRRRAHGRARRPHLVREQPRLGRDGLNGRSGAGMSDAEHTGDGVPEDPGAYVQQVMAEIAEEVRLRRASGDLPPRLERELDELFLAHSPIGVRGGDLSEALRLVDAATFIDPVVPVESERAAGAVVKKGMRTMMLWYVGWVTHQMSQSASAVSRALHIVDGHLKELERRIEAQRSARRNRRRVPHVCGPRRRGGSSPRSPRCPRHLDGCSTRPAVTAGWSGGSSTPDVDAYGIDPRAPVVDAAELGALDLRDETHHRTPARGRRGRPRGHRAQRDGGGHGGRGAHAPPRRDRRPSWLRAAR